VDASRPYRADGPDRPRNGSEPYGEWFGHGSVQLPWPRPPLAVGHLSDGGTRIGEVVRVWDSGAWIDAITRVDDGEAGDIALDGIGGDGGRLPVSIGFRPVSSVEYPGEGIMRTKVDLTEVAIVEQSAYGDNARTYARGFPPPPTWKRRT
jgi:hypothetical protein